jgi:hypothetical protein
MCSPSGFLKISSSYVIAWDSVTSVSVASVPGGGGPEAPPPKWRAAVGGSIQFGPEFDSVAECGEFIMALTRPFDSSTLAPDAFMPAEEAPES